MNNSPQKWILLADGNYSNRITLRHNIEQRGYGILEIDTCTNVLTTVRNQEPSIIIINRDLPEGNVIEIVETLHKSEPQIKIALTFNKEDMLYAAKAMKAGADYCLLLPIDIEKLEELLKSAVEKHIKILQSKNNNFEYLISSNVKNMLERIAPTDASVLIEGETGTEKELATSTLYNLSKRNNMPIITINGPIFNLVILIENIKVARQKWKIPIRDILIITLIVNNVDEINKDHQAELAYFLRYSDIEQIGPIDIRVIATTSKDLNELVKKKEFRQDLYMFVNVVAIKLLPLRFRNTELTDLAKHLVNVYSEKHKRIISVISVSWLKVLQNYDWPGNIKELENIIERSVILAENQTIKPDCLPDEILYFRNDGSAKCKSRKLKSVIEDTEKIHIESILTETNWNRKLTAKILGIDIATLYRKIEKYKI